MSNKKSTSIVTRCSFQSAAGRRCRLSAHPNGQGYCLNHSRRALAASNQPFREDDLSNMLATPGGAYASQITIHHFLTNLLHALATNRVSPRRASSLAYITGLIAQTQKAAKEEVANWADEKYLCYSLAEMQGFKFPRGYKGYDDSDQEPDSDSTPAPSKPTSAS